MQPGRLGTSATTYPSSPGYNNTRLVMSAILLVKIDLLQDLVVDQFEKAFGTERERQRPDAARNAVRKLLANTDGVIRSR